MSIPDEFQRAEDWLDDFQELADRACKRFKMRPLIVTINTRLRGGTYGRYHGDHITLYRRAGVATVLHELAHHLDHTRFEARAPGYFHKKIVPSMVPCPGRPGWYHAAGPPKPIYYKIARDHGKNFRECYSELVRWYRRITPQG